MTCEHGFIGACADCDGAGQQPEDETIIPRRPRRRRQQRRDVASREEQHGRYLDCGPGAWDDRGPSHD